MGYYNFNPRYYDIVNEFGLYEIIWIVTFIIALISLIMVMGAADNYKVKFISFTLLSLYLLSISTLFVSRIYMQTYYHTGHYGYFTFERMFTETFRIRQYRVDSLDIARVYILAIIFYTPAIVGISQIYMKYLWRRK